MSPNDSHQAILQTLASIPSGYVCTYGAVAKLSGNAGKARYVGHILKNLPQSSSIPWHRVINSQGRSSFPAHSERHTLQITRLEKEGVQIINGKIKLKTYLWQG